MTTYYNNICSIEDKDLMHGSYTAPGAYVVSPAMSEAVKATGTVTDQYVTIKAFDAALPSIVEMANLNAIIIKEEGTSTYHLIGSNDGPIIPENGCKCPAIGDHVTIGDHYGTVIAATCNNYTSTTFPLLPISMVAMIGAAFGYAMSAGSSSTVTMSPLAAAIAPIDWLAESTAIAPLSLGGSIAMAVTGAAVLGGLYYYAVTSAPSYKSTELLEKMFIDKISDLE